MHVSHRHSDEIAALNAEIEHLKSLNKDAHAIIDKVWAIFGTPTYEQLEGRTIYDMVQNCVDREREAAAVNEQAAGVIYDKMAHIERLEAVLEAAAEALEPFAKAHDEAQNLLITSGATLAVYSRVADYFVDWPHFKAAHATHYRIRRLYKGGASE